MDNDIVYQARLHWIIFAWPVILFAITMAAGLNIELLRQPSMLFGALMLLWGLSTYGVYRFCSLTIKASQIVLRRGLFTRFTTNIPMDKIESIDIRQSIFGTIFGYGDLVITGTGGTREEMTYVSKPLTCRRYIEQMMHR